MGEHFIQTVTTTLEFGDPCDGPNIDRLSVRACNTTEKVAKMSVFSLPVNNLTKLFGSNE